MDHPADRASSPTSFTSTLDTGRNERSGMPGLSASFLSQLDNQTHTPSARVSFDDHHSYMMNAGEDDQDKVPNLRIWAPLSRKQGKKPEKHPSSLEAQRRPRSSSQSSLHGNGPLRAFAKAGVPGTLPHSAVLADDGASQHTTDTQEGVSYPWDTPRALASTVSLPTETTVTKSQQVKEQQQKQVALSTTQPESEKQEEQGKDQELTQTLWQKIKMTCNYLSLYRFCDRVDYGLIVVGMIAAIASGVPLPLIGILFGELIDSFNSISCLASGQGRETSSADFMSSVNTKVTQVAIVAAANFALIWIYTSCWSNLGERLVRKMRERYLTSVLRQDMAFFDTMKPGQVGTSLSADLLTIQNGTSEKMGILISSLSYFVTSYIVCFIKLPVLAAQLVSLLPAFGIISIVGSRFVAKAQKKTSSHLSHAASLASEALNNLTVVHAFSSQKRLSNIYQSHLDLARGTATRRALCAALVLGSLFFVGYSANALAFFSGSNLIADAEGESNTVGSVYTVIFLLLDASFIIGQIAPYLQIFSAASGSGQTLMETIRKESAIDGTDREKGMQPQPGDFDNIAITFENVEFAYPSRPETNALNKLQLTVEAGLRVGIVGMSGSGKSTIAALTQRFYDPNTGSVRMNGIDIRDLNVRWYRSQMGVVGQEPVLFDCSIMQSIAHGLVSSPAHEHLHEAVLAFSQVGQDDSGCSMNQLLTAEQKQQLEEEVYNLCIEAAKMADAHDFISKLPQGYDTPVGAAGSKLSGGQKQRICIARAVVKQPRLLILDEATAALDSHSERTVSAALNAVSEGRTTIAIAHRLATIRNYDKIVVVGAGKVLEQGTHKELLAKRGFYFKLAQAQNSNASDEENDDTASEGEAATPSSSIDEEKKRLKVSEALTPPPANKEKQEPESTKRYPPSVIIRRICSMIRREWLFVIAGLITSTIMGGSYSGEAALFGHVIDALNPCNGDDSVRREGRRFALFFFILALIQFFAYSINGLMWGTVAERLLFRIRRLSFESLLSQRLTWYEDQPDSSPGSMIAALSNDANNLGGLTGTVIGTIFCIFVNLTAGIILSHAVAWRIAIVILCMVPIILLSGYMRLKVLADFQKRHETAYVKSNSLAMEAVSSIRTVAALGREEDVRRKFERSLVKPYNETLRHFLVGNIFLAIALSISYFIYAFAYWWGSRNVAEGRYSQVAFLTVLPALLFSAQASGQLLAFAPDFSKAHVSAANLLRFIDQRPPRDGAISNRNEEEKGTGGSWNPKAPGPLGVEFKDVWFTYPTRDDPALRGINLSIQPGTFAAFVGTSGSGKSTAMALIESFYSPSSGSVLVNNRDAATLDPDILRKDIALVPQEPVIFYGTVRFNISLGLAPDLYDADDDDDLKMYKEDIKWQTSILYEQIERACKLAGIHETILQLPQGYDTLIQSCTLSGGQKQRVAIARALIRQPRLLLLDESTSALDAQSEQAFQVTLDEIAKKGDCTIVAIAHRMRTIRDADRVFCFEDGEVVESGGYRELIRGSARFKAMVAYQSLN